MLNYAKVQHEILDAMMEEKLYRNAKKNLIYGEYKNPVTTREFYGIVFDGKYMIFIPKQFYVLSYDAVDDADKRENLCKQLVHAYRNENADNKFELTPISVLREEHVTGKKKPQVYKLLKFQTEKGVEKFVRADFFKVFKDFNNIQFYGELKPSSPLLAYCSYTNELVGIFMPVAVAEKEKKNV